MTDDDEPFDLEGWQAVTLPELAKRMHPAQLEDFMTWLRECVREALRSRGCICDAELQLMETGFVLTEHQPGCPLFRPELWN